MMFTWNPKIRKKIFLIEKIHKTFQISEKLRKLWKNLDNASLHYCKMFLLIIKEKK